MQLNPVPPPGPLTLTRERGRVALRLVCVPMGRDLAVTLDGGDRSHIGAVAVSQPRPSHGEGGGLSATTSVITLPGHKEDDLARAMASRLAAGLDAVVCAACGIHLDRIRPDELKDVLELAEDLTSEALDRLRECRAGTG
jgi:gallate decarboxylase subunit D